MKKKNNNNNNNVIIYYSTPSLLLNLNIMVWLYCTLFFSESVFFIYKDEILPYLTYFPSKNRNKIYIYMFRKIFSIPLNHVCMPLKMRNTK